MNQGRIWCVVNPTVGLPLLLGGVALTSLAVHTAVMTHTSWMSNYWQGAARVRPTDPARPASAAAAQPAYVLSIAPVAGTPGRADASFVVTVAPNPNAPPQAASPPATPAAAAVGRTASNAP